MPHQCVHCSKIIDVGSREILEGCSGCSGKFFFYIRDEQAAKLKEKMEIEFQGQDKKAVEKDVRNILNITDEDKPVILDLESVRVLKPGKFELDLVSLLNRKPIVFKLEEGKYIIDLESALPKEKSESKKKKE
jgi:uncharacterized protein